MIIIVISMLQASMLNSKTKCRAQAEAYFTSVASNLRDCPKCELE